MVVNQVIDCLRRHDKQHREIYDETDRVNSLIERLGNISNFICTEDKGFAGNDPRVDLYVQTDKEYILVELKLCITSGGTLGRYLLPKVISTLKKLMQRNIASPKDVDVLIVVPKEASLDRVCNRLMRDITSELRAAGINVDTDMKCLPTLAFQGALALRTRRPISLEVDTNFIKPAFYVIAI